MAAAIIPSDREWNGKPGAPPAALERLRVSAPVALPEQYYELLAYSNGGEGPLPCDPLYFLLYEAEYAATLIEDNGKSRFFAGFLIFGSNGGGAYIGFATGKSEPWPILAVDMIYSTYEESVVTIAPDFAAFLEMVGLE